jgi:type II secretory pathway component GspD/PulD (secretin)
MRTRPSLPITIVALLAVSSVVRSLAQPAEPAAAPAVPPADQTAEMDGGSATRGRDAIGRDTLSVDFPDEDIRNILRNVADLFELNIIMPESLQGRTTIKLRDVTWRQIFHHVLQPVGFTYIEDGNIIKIVSNESLQQEPVETQVFLVNYARAADILPTISTLVDPASGGRIVVDARTNSLVITERPSRMNRIRPIIETLDRATDQVMIESKFVEVTDRDVKNIGVNWSSLAAYNVSVGNMGGTFERERGNLFDNQREVRDDTGQRSDVETLRRNESLNTRGQSSGATNSGSVTSVGGVPTATSTTGTTSELTNTSLTSVGNDVLSTVTDTTDRALNLLNTIAYTGGTTRTAQAVFNADEFRLVLSALQAQNDVKVVSNPTIVTLNNTEASINVGEETPIPNYAYNQERGSFEVNGFTWKQIGIILRVTPQVNARGDIKLTLAPEVSQRNGETTFGGAGGASIPIVATRKAITQVSLKDGYTMGIGGLLSTQTSKGTQRVPVLGSLPVLGRLFRSDSRDSAVTNLIIFITAKTLSASGAPVEQVFESERVRQLELRREDLPGYRDGSDPFLPSTAATATPLRGPEGRR